MWIFLGCDGPTSGDPKDTSPESGADTGADTSADTGETSHETSEGESGEPDTGDTDTGDPDTPVADCLRFAVLDVCPCLAWTVDWSLLTTSLAGTDVTPRNVDGGAVYAYGLDAETVAGRLCEGTGIEPEDVLDFEFWEAEAMVTNHNVAPTVPDGGSLLVRIDEPGGAVHMYALFQVTSASEVATLAVLDTSARWER